MNQGNSNQLVVGKTASVQSTYTPWPQPWRDYWPGRVYSYPTVIENRSEEYANEITVEQNEHDATLHFYRSSGPNKGKTLVKTVTIPLSLLEWLHGAA